MSIYLGYALTRVKVGPFHFEENPCIDYFRVDLYMRGHRGEERWAFAVVGDPEPPQRPD